MGGKTAIRSCPSDLGAPRRGRDYEGAPSGSGVSRTNRPTLSAFPRREGSSPRPSLDRSRCVRPCFSGDSRASVYSLLGVPKGLVMSLFGFLSRKKRVSGTIAYFGLEDWWFSAFSEHERRYIQQRFQPLGSSGNSVTSGDISYTSQSVGSFLSALAGWFGKKEDRPIAYRILEKAEELSKTESQILDIHFLYGEQLALYYKDRDNPTF